MSALYFSESSDPGPLMPLDVLTTPQLSRTSATLLRTSQSGQCELERAIRGSSLVVFVSWTCASMGFSRWTLSN
eukprot:767926-Amphidinium_carterae.1